MTKTTDSLSDVEQAQLAHEVAADQYDREWPLRTTYGNSTREAFIAGWHAALEYAEKKQSGTT